MYDLAREMVKKGHKVTVYTSDALDVLKTKKRISAARETLDGIEIVRFPRLGPALPSKFLRVIVKDFKKEISCSIKDYDIVHLSEVRNYMNMTAAAAARKASVPYFISVFGNLAPQKAFHKRALISLYDRIWTRKMFRRAAGLLVQNGHEKEVCLKYGIESSLMKFCPLPVHFSAFRDLPLRGLFRKKFNIGPEARIIVSLGRLHHDKGFQFLLKAFASLHEMKDVFLVIIGADEGYGEELKNLSDDLKVQDRVIFPGALYDRDKLQAFVDADVFALTPLVYEETSLAALEACASGLPVIVSDRNSIPWLQDYGAGMEIPLDEKELSGAMELLLADREKRQSMGARGRAMIQEKFTVEKVVEGLEAVFREAA